LVLKQTPTKTTSCYYFVVASIFKGLVFVVALGFFWFFEWFSGGLQEY